MTVPTLALPLSIAADGSLATLGQDSIDEITQSVNLLLRTETGERLDAPDYGSPEWVPGRPDPSVVTALAQRWEPRAALTVTVSGPDATGAVNTQVLVDIASGVDRLTATDASQ